MFSVNTQNYFMIIASFLTRNLHIAVGLFCLLAPSIHAEESFFEFTEEATVVPMPTGDRGLGKFKLLQALGFDEAYFQFDGNRVQRIENGEVNGLPDMANDSVASSAAVVEDRLYAIVAGQLMQLPFRDAGPGWELIGELPEGLQPQAGLVDLQGRLYLYGMGEGGSTAYYLEPSRNTWKSLSTAPYDLRNYTAISCGNDHLLFFSAQSAQSEMLAYHRTTDTWFQIARLPQPMQVYLAGSEGTQFILYGAESVLRGEAVLRPTKYGWVDHVVVAILILLLVVVGLRFSNKGDSSGDYFRGGQRIPWWAAGLSLFATGASAISLMAMPGKAFAENWIYMSISFFIVIVQIPLFLLVYIPVARRLKIATANEYLERRFGLPVRMVGFVCFSLNQMLGRMASILLLPALAISAIFGMPMEYSILIMGVATTLFVTMGGLEAVIWTDVLQAIIMLLAVLVCAAYAYFAIDMSGQTAIDLLSNLNKLQLFDWSFNWQGPVVLVLALNSFVTVLGIIGDQNFIQRVQCTEDEKESRKAVYTQLAVAVPMNLVLFVLGTLLFLFYATRADTLSPALRPDSVFPFFAAQNLPVGFAGFVVVALLAATISTVSSAMNSVANLGVEDVYRRFVRGATDAKCVKLGRYLTFGLGIFGTGAALLLANMSSLQSIWDLFIMITGMVLAPITGIFVLGIFTRRANNFGVLTGSMASIMANYYAKFHMEVHALVYMIIGVFACIIVGYFASYCAPKPKVDLNGLTVFSLLKRKD